MVIFLAGTLTLKHRLFRDDLAALIIYQEEANLTNITVR